MDQRIDPLSGQSSIIVAARQSRPNLPSSGCPFCPGGLEAPEPYDVRWFPNRWPALTEGCCEVVLYTPEHDAEFWTLGVAAATKVVRLWADRTAALGARDDVDYVLVFENRGPAVGATIAHPHGQIYAYERIPPVALSELIDGDLLPEAVDHDLLVATAGGWSAWVPDAATWPYELLLAPRRRVGSLTDDAADHAGLAELLIDVLARLDQLFDEPMPYMMWIHQRPTDGAAWPDARLHVHITPLLRAPGVQRYVAAAELGGGIAFNPVAPAAAASQLRACPGPP